MCVLGQIHVDKRLSDIKKELEKGKEIKGGLLTHMLVTREMNLEEIYANMTEMLLAGVDTVRTGPVAAGKDIWSLCFWTCGSWLVIWYEFIGRHLVTQINPAFPEVMLQYLQAVNACVLI